jgi:hypothetical protein
LIADKNIYSIGLIPAKAGNLTTKEAKENKKQPLAVWLSSNISL